jgi:hypothetical protein
MIEINILNYCGNFAENKDAAKKLREEIIKPAIKEENLPIQIDFDGVDSSTQSFIHALLSSIFQKEGEKTLDYFEFLKCNEAIQSLITTVINYSLE